jgi:AAA ATPase domain
VPSRPNPYTPGAGDPPRALVGRDEQLSLAETIRTQLEADYAANCLLFTGLRGVGKTVLLKEVRNRFIDRGWLATYVQIRPSVPVDRAFAQVAIRASRQLSAGARLGKALKTLGRRGGGLQILGQGATIGAASGSQDGYRELTDILEQLGHAARADGVGVALIVDELQALKNAPLGDLMNMIFTLRDEVPLAFIGCGLPYLPSKISKATTSTERLRYEPTDFLIPPDARRAVAEPARLDGVSWDDDALGYVVELAQGYPYFLQLYASETWFAAGRERDFSSVTRGDVLAAVPVVQRQLDTGLYGSRFGKLGPNQREYMFAMEYLMRQHAARTVRSGDVARHLAKSGAQASPVRDGLLRSGMIHAPARGELEFSVPGFADYLARRQESEGA